MNFSSAGNFSQIDDDASVNMSTPIKLPTINYEENSDKYLTAFTTWNDYEQLIFVENFNMDK
jgi:hypothetical protein